MDKYPTKFNVLRPASIYLSIPLFVPKCAPPQHQVAQGCLTTDHVTRFMGYSALCACLIPQDNPHRSYLPIKTSYLWQITSHHDIPNNIQEGR